MDCRTFRELLDRYLSGNLAPHLFDQMVEHEAGCAACHEVAAAMMSAPGVAWSSTGVAGSVLSPAHSAPGQSETSTDWLGRTLERTVGADCTYVRLRLAEAVDAPLVPDTARRVDLHLENCAACAALATVLRDLPSYYAALEHLHADHAFATEILARTMPARPSWLAVLRVLVRRPEALWEGAVVCALLTTPLAGPSMTDWLRSVRQAGSQVEQRVGRQVALGDITSSLGNHVIAAAAEVGATIDGGRQSVLDGLTRMRARVENSITSAIDNRAASDPRVAVVAPALKDALGRIGLIADDSLDHIKPAQAGEAAAGHSTAPAATGPNAPVDSAEPASPPGPVDSAEPASPPGPVDHADPASLPGPVERFGTTVAPGHQGTEVETDELR